MNETGMTGDVVIDSKPGIAARGAVDEQLAELRGDPGSFSIIIEVRECAVCCGT